MNKKQLTVAWVILFISALPLFAQDNHSIDNFLEECINKYSSTAGMVQCGEEAYKKWEAELNKYYNLLMAILNKDAKERLMQSQLAWLNFRDKEFEFINEGYFLDVGSYIGPAKTENKVEIVKVRALELKKYYEITTGKSINE